MNNKKIKYITIGVIVFYVGLLIAWQFLGFPRENTRKTRNEKNEICYHNKPRFMKYDTSKNH